MAEPYIDRTNIISRYKERKHGRNIMLFGKDCDADANSRSNARMMFDGDLLIQGDLLVRSAPLREASANAQQECALDYTFCTLGIDTDTIEHPIVMTERLANPIFTRTSESE